MFSTFLKCSQMSRLFYHSVIHGLGYLLYDIEVMGQKTIKHAFCYVLYFIKHRFLTNQTGHPWGIFPYKTRKLLHISKKASAYHPQKQKYQKH